MSDAVLTEVADGVMTITINRPKAKNAVNLDVAKGIAAAMDELDSNDSIQVAILTGAEGTFCSGMDLKAFVSGEMPFIEGKGFAGLVQFIARHRSAPRIAPSIPTTTPTMTCACPVPRTPTPRVLVL